MDHQKGTMKSIEEKMGRTKEALEALIDDPRFLGTYHAKEKREAYFLDVVLMGTDGMVVTPARVAWGSRFIVPGWTPDQQSDFAKTDGVRRAWLVLHAPQSEEGPTWYPIVDQHNIFFTFKDEDDWEALEWATNRLGKLAENKEEEVTASIDLESWLRAAPADELLMLADTQWGRKGVLDEARESLAAHYTGREGEVFQEYQDQAARVTIDSDPDAILEWLYRNRPWAFATVVLVPYTQEFHPAAICVQMDDWLNRAIQVAHPGLNISETDGRAISEIAREMLERIPDDVGESKEGGSASSGLDPKVSKIRDAKRRGE
ncbi:hypothetical protein [Thioalkalivibrio sp. ALE16]|uniref:hypothetical protein n=1 Tax=Thioalkalivibrio sp. ALE16 TaxID=1158172 RepID=UPI00035D9685|nr:hypothetical protein [Thioalkalivibrio sp. ALE16]